MRIPFDQGTPVPLRRALHGHQVTTGYELRWATLLDGSRLVAAEQDGFEVFITTDQQLRFQQRLADRRLAILVLGSTSGRASRPIARRFGRWLSN